MMTVEQKQQPPTTLQFSAAEVLLLVIISLTWIIPIGILQFFDVKHNNDFSDLLFGAASVALFMLSFLVAILGIFGWQNIQEIIKDRVQIAVRNETERMSSEIRARHLNGLGFMIGEQCHGWNALEPTNEEHLEHAIDLCRSAYNEIAKIQSADPILPLLIQNNFIFYSTLRRRTEDGDLLLEKARDLRRKCESLNRDDFLLTYCRVVTCYSEDPAERGSVRKILEGLKSRVDLPSPQRREAVLYLKHFEPKPQSRT